MTPSPAIAVMNVVCAHYGLQTAQLSGRCRINRYVLPRQIAYWLCAEVVGMSMMEIGRKFDRDHTTVMHGVKQAQKRLSEPLVAKAVNILSERVREACGLTEAFAVLRSAPARVTFTMTYPRRVGCGVSREAVAA